MARRADSWTREQLVAALALYCQLPFGRMHNRSPEIVALATRIGRTPSAVALKLANFANFDPEHARRGVSGMPHTAKLDRDVWDAYYGKWDQLADATREEDAAGSTTPLREQVTEVFATVRQRVGQGFFRNCVLGAYESKCCLTGIAAPELLRASHIIPWAESEQRRLDPHNGLCLNALHDAAFDRGLITFDVALKCQLSPHLAPLMPATVYAAYFLPYGGRELTPPARFHPAVDCLRWHAAHRFRGPTVRG